MLKARIITKKLKLILLATWLLMSNLSPALALEAATPSSSRYDEMTLLNGTDSKLMLYINKKSLNIDLLRTNNIRVRIKTTGLYSAIEKISSFKISMYEIINGERQFVTSQTLTIFKGSKKSRVISIGAGYFAAPVKQVEFDVFDTEGNLINTYATELTATNLASQVSGGAGMDLGSAECDYTNFDDCQLDYLFNRITFEAKPQKQVSTRVIKSEEGLYKVTIPVPRSQFKFLGRSVNRGKKDGMNTGNGNGASLDSFGETLSITDIKIGPDASNFGVISYDPFDAQFTFGPSNATTPVVIGADGKVGIGVDPANGFLDVRGGDGTTPSVIIEPGLLAAAPPNGALEFDGSNIYFTKGGVRSPLGERGPAGIPGPTGATGPVGPVGPSGSTSLANTTLVNGDMIFVNGALLENATLNGSITITPGSVVSVNGVTFEGPHITFNGTVFSDRFNATLFNGTTFNGITANFTNLNATNFIATNLSGNGAGLTNVDARTLNGLDFTSFLRSNLSDTFNGVELDFSAASKLDLNGDLEIADTMIEFDGGDTTFNGSGAFSIKPALDQNVSINTAANGDFIVKNNLIFAEGHNGNVGIGLTEPPEKLTVNGILALREGVSIPPGSAGYGKLYVKTADAKLYFHSSDGNDYDLTAAASGGGDAGTLDGIDSAEFLRSNTNTTYSSGTFTINSGTTFDVNSGNVSIRDNSINFDTATSTTFNGSGAFTIRPMSGSNLNVNLANTGDFKINTNDLVVDTSAGFIGLGTAAPQQPLHIDAAGLGSSNASVLMTAKEGSNWIYGVDNGDSAKFKLANGNDLTTNVVFTALKSGNIGIGYINPQAKLHVNGQILATVFNGTFIGDGSGLTGVASSNGSVTNVTINNGSTYNSTFSNSYFNGDTVFNAGDTFFNNGITAFNNGDIFFNNGTKLFFNGGTMEGNVTINGAVHADEYHARLFNGDVFNGGIFRGTFVGDASGLTGVVSSTGNATTLDNLDSSAFLRSNTTTAFTLGTLNLGTSTTLDVNGTAQFDGTTFDVNSTTVSIADTNITLDGAFTKFTQSFGAIQMIPGSGATFTVNGAMTFVPSTTVSVAAGVSIPVTNSIVKIVGNSGPVNLSNGHQLTTGADGQIIILRGTNNTNTVTLEEANGLALTDGLSFILGNKDTMSLMYDASDDQWIEISRSDK